MREISKYELVTEIVMLCDELETCRRERDALRHSVETLEGSGDSVDGLDLYCMMYGRKKVFEDCTSTYWNHAEATRTDAGDIHVTSFEDYREMIYTRCPDVVSKTEFLSYFDAEFHAAYEVDKEKAVAKLEEEEADDE